MARRIRTSSKRSSLVGQRFRSVVADGNPLWEVKSHHASGVYLCEVVNEPLEIDGRTYDSDFAGRQEYFHRSKIEKAIEWHAFQEAHMKAHEDFYASLELGAIVHYHDGFGQFVRCEVVVNTEPTGIDHPEIGGGGCCLKEVALVGAWRESDLSGNSYHARGVFHGRRFKPNASNIWENLSSNCHKKYADPRALPALEIKGQQEMWA